MNLINPNIEICSTYDGHDKPIHCICKRCGYEWYPMAGNLLYGKGCVKCYHSDRALRVRKTHAQFIEEAKSANPNLEILGHYVKRNDKIACECKIHHSQFEMFPYHILSGQTSCRQCIAIKNHLSGLKTQEDFEKDLRAITDEIEVIGEYIGSKQRIDVLCKKCGHQWRPEASSLLSGFGCPNCHTVSKGELLVEKVLQDLRLEYQKHVAFNDLRGVGGGKLTYDFYLPQYKTLIEFQGVQHERPVSVFGGEEYFNIQREHDERKTRYANDNGYTLLVIWYNQTENIYERIQQIITQESRNDHSLKGND